MYSGHSMGFPRFRGRAGVEPQRSMLSQAVAKPTADLAQAQGDTAEEDWRRCSRRRRLVAEQRSLRRQRASAGTVAGFQHQRLRFAGGWLGTGPPAARHMRTTDGGASWQPWGGEGIVGRCSIWPSPRGSPAINGLCWQGSGPVSQHRPRGDLDGLWSGLPGCETGWICSIARIGSHPVSQMMACSLRCHGA